MLRIPHSITYTIFGKSFANFLLAWYLWDVIQTYNHIWVINMGRHVTKLQKSPTSMGIDPGALPVLRHTLYRVAIKASSNSIAAYVLLISHPNTPCPWCIENNQCTLDASLNCRTNHLSQGSSVRTHRVYPVCAAQNNKKALKYGNTQDLLKAIW